MAIKTTFEPKDPRITFEEEYNSDDQHDWTSDEKPRKRKTGTQALVEFLNTTSPEEFQKDSPKRSSSALFFRRRKPANNKTMAVAPVLGPTPTIHRKNYIEIIANPFMFNKTKSPNSSATTPINAGTTVIGSQLNRTLSKSSTSIYSVNAAPTPPLPIRKGISSKDSHMYNVSSGGNTSLHSISTQTSRSPSVLTKAGFVRRQPSLRADTAKQPDERKALPMNILPVINNNNVDFDDAIEGGLKYRLNQYKTLQLDKPSDIISKTIAQEHTAALQMLFSLTHEQQQMDDEVEPQQQQRKKKRRPRHIQVQTMPYTDQDTQVVDVAKDVDMENERQLLDHQVTKQRLEKVEKELKQEKLINSRLEAALEETRDQYEVLSGLAYKKLREVWEEKVRWENACIETKERCWHDHQQQILGNLEDSQSVICPSLAMEFLLEEENEYEEEEEHFIP